MASAQLEVAIQAARRAGNMINRESLSLDSIEVQEKAPFDFVSRVDTTSQDIIKGMVIMVKMNRKAPSNGVFSCI